MKKQTLSHIVIFCFFAVFIACSFFLETNTNLCYVYTNKYLDSMPQNASELEEIDYVTKKALSDSFFTPKTLFSKYSKRHFVTFTASLVIQNPKSMFYVYYTEVVSLRLKLLLIQNNTEEFIQLFVDNYPMLVNTCMENSINIMLVYDKNYPVEYKTTEYKMIESAYKKLLEKHDNNSYVYFVLHDMMYFYSEFDEATKEENECKKMLESLANEIGREKLKEVILKGMPISLNKSGKIVSNR